jgi:fucose 4-O-acetylase-like acetyltransferase
VRGPLNATHRWLVTGTDRAILVLLAVSALVVLFCDFSRGLKFLSPSLVFLIASTTVLQHEGFGFLAGIAIIVTCFRVNKVAYLIGATLVGSRVAGPMTQSLHHDQPHDDPGESSHNDIGHEGKR